MVKISDVFQHQIVTFYVTDSVLAIDLPTYEHEFYDVSTVQDNVTANKTTDETVRKTT